ncbi:histidine--tRNA ligase [Cellulomonas sp. APG4]|uniref:histidine--tRNA ligase n=1 Tax=Cellulomonas sp. APG4 TaxID=1538656 RepID=UPI00137A1A3A|nr:histidine--tRNA ligase [Cellulomonas sp. APG4]NCT90888.1 histidine--tRNA ligase [Cellulomonas sp. APG4]
MARPTPLSGFPELLPDARLVEQHVLDVLRRTFELHGFTGIETRAVEPLEQLLRKGETSKEVYVLDRLQADPGEATDRAGRLGLHFDLTVPFARYVVENAGRLVFPFRRYQIQKVWRGERPQDGRFREFTQADIDVVAQGELPYHYEVELPLVIAEAFAALAEVGMPPVRISVNNRRVVEGFSRGLGLDDVEAVLRSIDKLDKIGPDAVAELLVRDAGASQAQARAMLELAAVHGQEGVVARVRDLARTHGVVDEQLEQGLVELDALVTAAVRRAPGVVVADLRIARGLDYYTGSVYETTLVGHEKLGSICSGGRYDALATDGTTTYPGVGLSVGVTRLVSRLVQQGLVRATRSVPTAVLVAVTTEDERAASEAVADALRARGIPVEVAPAAARFGKQIRHADRRGIPFVWFPASAADDGGAQGHQVKDIRSGDQVDADPTSWQPPAEDLWPRVEAGEVGETVSRR